MDDPLKNWAALTEMSRTLTEEQAIELLEREKRDGRRLSFMMRLHQVINKRRGNRERAVIAQIAATKLQEQ